MFYIYTFILGLLLGSFYNVVGLRVPKQESVIWPPSHCSSCEHPLASAELIPFFSFLFLKGKCRYCQSRISFLYPIIELATASLFTIAFWKAGPSRELIVAWMLVSLLVIVFVSDIRYLVIPDRVLVVFAFLFLLARFWIAPFPDWWLAFAGAGVGFVMPFLVAVVSCGGMGGGDIKLFAVLGLALGWKGVLTAFVFSTFFGAFIGGIGLLTGKIHRGHPIPFGPFIGLGALAAYFFGHTLLKWYFHL